MLLLVLSPGYLKSVWCRQEMAAFHEEIHRRKASRGRVFVVEFDRVDPNRKSPELADLKGYRFWVEDPDTRNPVTLGYPIVRERDEEYHKRLNDLCIELVRELEALKQSEQEAPEFAPWPGLDTRPTVYLAEVTEDLETRRDTVRRHLDQAGFRVLPDAEPSRDDYEAYRDSVDDDLARSVLFVQLLSETPGRRLKGADASYVALQQERALAVGRPVLQWRRRELDTSSGEIPDDHRRRLNGATVVATDLSEFKSLVVETVKKLTATPQPPGEQVVPGDADKLIFVDAEETDLEAARAIIMFFAAHGIGALPPVRGTTPEAIRSALKTRMLACDGMILVNGNNPDWPILQWTNFRKVKVDARPRSARLGFAIFPRPIN